MIVVEANSNRDGDTVGAVGGADEERVFEVVRGARLSHHGNWKCAGVQCMRSARRDAHDTPQAFLNKRKRTMIERDSDLGSLPSWDDVLGSADDLSNHVRLREYSRRNRAIGRCQFQ